MEPDQQIRYLAARQQCLVTRHQMRQAGLSRAGIRHRLSRGEWEALGPRVLRLAGSMSTPKQELMAAVLDVHGGAVVSHESAAALWGLPGFWPGPLEVCRPRGTTRTRPNFGELHESTWLPPAHVTTVDGIPVTGVGRTVFDLAGVVGMKPARVERTLENAVSLSPAVLPRLHALLAELAGRGRPGVALMRELLDERPLGYIPPASGLEARVIALLEEAGVATRRQVNLGDGDHWIGRVDLQVIGAPVVVEADSAIHHLSKLDKERDRQRDGKLEATGMTVVRVTDEEAFRRPWLVAPKVLAAVRLRRCS